MRELGPLAGPLSCLAEPQGLEHGEDWQWAGESVVWVLAYSRFMSSRLLQDGCELRKVQCASFSIP